MRLNIAQTAAVPTAGTTAAAVPVSDGPSFIETQFPVSLLSKESYKERSAKNSQTLTPLGKWWGRKPLIVARAVILGLLMPASDDPHKDRETFLALLTMDDEGLWRRKSRNIALKEVHRLLTPRERSDWFGDAPDPNRPKLRKGVEVEDRRQLQRLAFARMGYDGKLKFCDRPEYLDGPSARAWQAINAHLGTTAASLPEMVQELGERRFGHAPRVGDAFCGGGSVTFEAARIGCEAHGSDLNPVAALLTWGALKIVGGGEGVAKRVREAQAKVFDAVDRQITAWRIEHNDAGWRAEAFLYCAETRCPECGWLVPLAPSWVVGEKPKSVARLTAQPEYERFAIDICSGVSPDDLRAARHAGTVKDSRLVCPNPDCKSSTPMAAIRGDHRGDSGRGYGLRCWESGDLVPRPDDVFQERLYCVRWGLPSLDELLWAEQRNDTRHAPIPEWTPLDHSIDRLGALLNDDDRRALAALRGRDWQAEAAALAAARRALQEAAGSGVAVGHKALRRRVAHLETEWRRREEMMAALTKALPTAVYRDIGDDDLGREAEVLTLLRDNLADWQRRGFLPSRSVAPGAKTNELIRTRGWTHWHHLFTPRQLLTLGLLSSEAHSGSPGKRSRVASVLGLSRCVDYNSKLSRWHTRTVGDKSEQTFSNQALNTMYSFAGRGLVALKKSFFVDLSAYEIAGCGTVTVDDARATTVERDIWLTDPPYADAVNYHELSEYLLAWNAMHFTTLFPDWYTDSKRALAVQGADENFRRSMVECYRNLTRHMPETGMQVVMFTHQDAAVWADLALILWASGLRVTAAWTIATETESSLKEGNYVQGTVLMVLRKQTADDTAFLDEVVPEVEAEVERQLASMRDLDDRDAPNFSDADYQLAAYAATLRVLTNYRAIEDLDVSYELSRERRRGEANPLAKIIEDAVRTASDFLVPAGLPPHVWRGLVPEEKLYLKGLEVETHGDFRAGVYQEFARGFGVSDYRRLLHTGRANRTRLKTASELKRADLAGRGIVRHALYAVWRAAETGDVTESLTWLHTELADYWPQREALIAVLRYLAGIVVDHWRADAGAARLLAGAVENDHV